MSLPFIWLRRWDMRMEDVPYVRGMEFRTENVATEPSEKGVLLHPVGLKIIILFIMLEGLLRLFIAFTYTGSISLLQIIFAISGIGQLLIAWGLWSWRRWGWGLATKWFSLTGLAYFGKLLTGDLSGLIGIFLSGFIVSYLCLKEVREKFRVLEFQSD